MALMMVASSTNSKSPPMGSPLASLVTLTDSFSKILAKYRQVASPSIVALVATVFHHPYSLFQ